MRSVKRRPDKVVHGRIDDDKFLIALILFEEHAGEKNSRIAGNDPARLENDRESKIFRLTGYSGAVGGRRRRFLGVVRDSQPTSKIQILQSQTFTLQFQNEVANALECLFERTHFGDLRSDVARDADDVQIRGLTQASVQRSRLRQADAKLVLMLSG